MDLTLATTLAIFFAIESSVLLRLTHDIKRIRARYPANEKETSSLRATALSIGAPLPRFTVGILDSTRELSEQDFRDRKNVLLFVDAADTTFDDPNLCATLAGMLVHSDGIVHVVCKGSADACRGFRTRIAKCHVVERRFPILLDEHGSVAERCGIPDNQTAIIIDVYGRVLRIGEQLKPNRDGVSS